MTPHDALFKAAFSQVSLAAEELRCVLPAGLVARMALDRLTLAAGSFVDDALRERHTDLLYQVPLAGRPAYVYVLFEHQSSDEPWMALRLLGYMVRIWDRCLADGPERLPVIIPVVLHHSDGGWRAQTRFEALVDPPPEAVDFTPHFGFALDDLARHDEAALRERAVSAFTRLVLLALQQTRGARDLTRMLGGWANLIHELLAAEDGRSAFRLIIRYIYEVKGPDAFAGIDINAIEIDSGGREIMESMAQYLHRTGRDEGRQEGRKEGRQEGRKELFLALVKHRFGALSPASQERVEAADDACLGRWSLRLLTAQTLAELFAEP